MSTITIPQIDKARVLEITCKVGRVAWRVTKSAACLLGNVVGVGFGLMFALVAYGAIIAPDALWLRLARHYPVFDPVAVRTGALVFGVIGIAAICDCVKAIERWIDGVFPPKGV